MADEPTTRKTLVLPDSMWTAIADFRFQHRIKSEAEAIRLLLADALARSAPRAGPAQE